MSELIASLLVKNVHPVIHENGAPASASIALVMLAWVLDDL